ncbi:MAG: hypothetical protein ACRC8F_04135 [Cetobacterium sp.]
MKINNNYKVIRIDKQLINKGIVDIGTDKNILKSIQGLGAFKIGLITLVEDEVKEEQIEPEVLENENIEENSEETSQVGKGKAKK